MPQNINALFCTKCLHITRIWLYETVVCHCGKSTGIGTNLAYTEISGPCVVISVDITELLDAVENRSTGNIPPTKAYLLLEQKNSVCVKESEK